jgi:hypothetical protein
MVFGKPPIVVPPDSRSSVTTAGGIQGIEARTMASQRIASLLPSSLTTILLWWLALGVTQQAVGCAYHQALAFDAVLPTDTALAEDDRLLQS